MPDVVQNHKDSSYLMTDRPFIVRESRAINFFIALFLLSMSICSAIYFPSILFTGLFALMGIIMIFIGIKRRTVFIIDLNGIIYYGEHLTDWHNFIKAYYQEENVKGSESSRSYYLYIEYRKEFDNSTIVSRIPMSSTFDKSEEQIIEAIESNCTKATSYLA